MHNPLRLCCYFVGVQFYGSLLYSVVFIIVFLVGFPGNILSASVWLRARITAKNSSAVYLGALAIVDLVAVCLLTVYQMIRGMVAFGLTTPVLDMVYYFGATFILAVSVERLIFYRFPSLVS